MRQKGGARTFFEQRSNLQRIGNGVVTRFVEYLPLPHAMATLFQLRAPAFIHEHGSSGVCDIDAAHEPILGAHFSE